MKMTDNITNNITNKYWWECKSNWTSHTFLVGGEYYFCYPMDSGPLASSIHEISQARILGWVDISYFRGFSQPRDQTGISFISCIGRWILYHQCHLGQPLYKISSTYIYLMTSSPLFSVYAGEMKLYAHKMTCPRICTEALFIIDSNIHQR